MADSPRPFAGTSVFLHLRDTVGNKSKDFPFISASAIRKECKTYIQELGASLALSERAAQLIIFHNGSEAFLKDCLDAGKAVVKTVYLHDCVKEGKRLPITSQYIPSYAPSKPSRKGDILSTGIHGNTPKRSPGKKSNGCRNDSNNNSRAIAYLLDEESSDHHEEEHKDDPRTRDGLESSPNSSHTGSSLATAILNKSSPKVGPSVA